MRVDSSLHKETLRLRGSYQDYLAPSDGLNLTKAFMRIPNPELRRSIVDLVEGIAGSDEND